MNKHQKNKRQKTKLRRGDWTAIAGFLVVGGLMSAGIFGGWLLNHVGGEQVQNKQPPQAQDESYGEAGVKAAVTRSIAVALSDTMQFLPAEIAIAQDETIAFELTNTGEIPHEFVLGTVAEVLEHKKVMEEYPDMIHEDEDHAVTVPPGETRTLLWKFTVPGRFVFACLVPGHYDAGMHGQIAVASLSGGKAPAPAAVSKAPAQGTQQASQGTQTAAAARRGQTGTGEGTIQRIDREKGTVLIKHGPLVGIKDSKGKDMPPMTMMFKLIDRRLLEGLHENDKARFTALFDNRGFTIQSIETVQ